MRWSTRTGSSCCAPIHAIFDDDQADGIVITHGTNTLEETAYFLNLTLKTDKPVVVVGSMRPSSAISADGYLNVLNAVRVAADPGSRGRGCLVVMNDTIFNARDVTKNSTYRVEAFQSRDLGPLGFADADGKVVYYHQPTRPHTIDTEFDVRAMTLPRVDIVLSYVGADGTMIEAAARAGAKGIVSAATGAGRPTPAEDAAFDKAYKENGMLMCLCSRVASGRVVRSPGLKQARLRRRRQSATVEGAHSAVAGAHQDQQRRRHPADVRYLLIGRRGTPATSNTQRVAKEKNRESRSGHQERLGRHARRRPCRAASPSPTESSSPSAPTTRCRTASRSSTPRASTSCRASSTRTSISGIPA